MRGRRMVFGRGKNMSKVKELEEKLANVGYKSNKEINYALLMALTCEKPLLIEGDPGVGKTALAQATADVLGLPLIRLQMYDELTDDRVMYDYDYQKQLLVLEAIKPALNREFEGLSINDTIHKAASELDFYGKEFLIERPILKAINGKGRKVLLIDECDKAPEEIEYMLYEFLENYSISIPQYGTIRCPEDQKPIVFITSNNYRELSGALKRRCVYLYIPHKTQEEIRNIILAKAGVDERIAKGISECLAASYNIQLRQAPSIAEGIEWARYIKGVDSPTKEEILASAGMLVKHHSDADMIKRIISAHGEQLWAM